MKRTHDGRDGPIRDLSRRSAELGLGWMLGLRFTSVGCSALPCAWFGKFPGWLDALIAHFLELGENARNACCMSGVSYALVKFWEFGIAVLTFENALSSWQDTGQ